MTRRDTPQRKSAQPVIAEPHAPAPPFPVDVFPAPLARFVTEVAASLPCPPDFVAVPLLAVLGAAIGNSRVLQVKPGWHEGPRLFTAVVADPGSKKSPALALVMQPLRERQQQVQAAAQHPRSIADGREVYDTSALPPAGDPGEALPSSPAIWP
jgi:Protein of unknown function (DUF3987)